MTRRGVVRLAGGAAAVALALPAAAPQLLAFPYHAVSHGDQIWSETPLSQEKLDGVMARAAALISRSPIAQPSELRHVFLTRGGWRWRWLTLANSQAFAVTRPVVEAIVVNRNDLKTDTVSNGAIVGGRRNLSGVIAHETCHGMERRRFGLSVDWGRPAWLREGYCDYVAQESSLAAADVARLKASGQSHPALLYYEGRRRVAEILDRNGGDVDRLFASD